MAIDYEAICATPPVELTQSYGPRDLMLYALGVGLGADPTSAIDLTYLYEKELRALPMMPVAMTFSSLTEMNLGADLTRALHGEQRLRIHQPLPLSGTMIGRTRVVDAIDNGIGKGALIILEREMIDATTGTLLATAGLTVFCLADGGFGGPARPKPAVHHIPEREADRIVDVPTSPRTGLIYRLSGDYHPLHVDPSVSKAAGFGRPILHGLAFYGIIGWTILKTMFEGDPDALLEFDGRFSAPFYPGETLRIEMWRDGATVSVRASAIERNKLVFNNGRFLSR